MANYLNGSFRGLALGMQFMQNQERLAAEKSMQVERIVANKALQDDRIAANAALQTERIAFDTKANDENTRRFDLTRGDMLNQQGIDNTNKANELKSVDAYRKGITRGGDEKVAVSQLAREQVEIQKRSDEDGFMSTWVQNEVADKFGGDYAAAASDPRFMGQYRDQLNANPGNSFGTLERQNPGGLTNYQVNYDEGSGEVFFSGTTPDGGQRPVTDDRGAAMDGSRLSSASGEDALMATTVAGHKAGAPHLSAIKNFLAEAGLEPDQASKMDLGGFLIYSASQQEGYTGPTLTVGGEDLNPLKPDPDSPAGKQLAELHKQRRQAQGVVDTKAASNQASKDKIGNAVSAAGDAIGGAVGAVKRGVQFAVNPSGYSADKDQQSIADIDAQIAVLNDSVKADVASAVGPKADPRIAEMYKAQNAQRQNAGPLRSKGNPVAAPPGQQMDLSNPLTKKALGVAALTNNNPEQILRALSGQQPVANTTTEHNANYIDQGLDPRTGQPTNDPLVQQQSTGSKIDFSNALTNTLKLYQGPKEPNKAFASRSSTATSAAQKLVPLLDDPTFVQGFRQAANGAIPGAELEVNQWGPEVLAGAAEYALRLQPTVRFSSVKK